MKERSDLAHIGSAWETVSVWEVKRRKQNMGYLYVVTANPVDQYSGSQPSLVGSRKRALRDMIALSRNACFLLMGMDCKDAFIFAFMSSQTICSSHRRIYSSHTSGSTCTVLSPTSNSGWNFQVYTILDIIMGLKLMWNFQENTWLHQC